MTHLYTLNQPVIQPEMNKVMNEKKNHHLDEKGRGEKEGETGEK